MKNYILVYETFIDYDSRRNEIERFDEEVELIERMKKLSIEWGDEFQILIAGLVHTEFKVKPVKYAIKYDVEKI